MFQKTSLPEKEDFCSHLGMESIADAEYTHAKRVCKDFEKNVCSKQHIIISWCTWNLSKYVSLNIWTWPRLLSSCTNISKASTLKRLK